MPEERVVGPITQMDVLGFAGACGDFNPLHYDQEVARRAGFDVPIAMGQMTAGIVAAWVADWCGVENLSELEVRFVAPVLVGDAITLTASQSEREYVDGREVSRFQVTVSKNEGAVMRGHVAVVLPSEDQ